MKDNTMNIRATKRILIRMAFWLCLIIPFLLGACNQKTTSVTDIAAITVTPQPSMLLKEMPEITLYLSEGTINSNSSVSLSFVIDKVSDVHVEPGSDSSEGVQVRIEDNSGKVLIPDQPQGTSFSFPGEVLTPGTYKVVFTSGALSKPASIGLQVRAKTTLGLEIQLTPPTAGSSKVAKVEATIIDRVTNKTVTGASVSGAMYIMGKDNSQKKSSLSLNDNGSNGDVKANDGKYTALLPNNLTSEMIVVEVEAKGTYNGVAFVRKGGEVTSVKSGALKFTDKYVWKTSSGGTVGATGNIDLIILEAEVFVQQSGSYNFEASIAAVDGKGSNYTTIQDFELKAGIQIIKLEFEVYQIKGSRLNPPFKLSSLRAYYKGSSNSEEADRVTDTSAIPILNLNPDQLIRVNLP